MAKVAARPGLRPRHVPQRTCVGCGSVTAKRQLIRIVRSPDGEVRPDPSGKAAGRGAYIHAARSCWEAALKKRLERSLNVALSPQNREALVEYAREIPEGTPE